MRKILHWGPLIALSIIKCISFTTLYYLGQWSSPLSSWRALINYLVYYSLLVTTLYNLICSILIGPGHVPSNWGPKVQTDEQFFQYCHQCNAFKAPRSHHCSKCKKCVLKMDHHCPWINNCCGYKNQRHFFYFLLSAVIGSNHSLILLSITLYRGINFIPSPNRNYIYFSVQGILFILLAIGLSFGVIIAVGGLLYIQTQILFRNQTSIEEWIVAKANHRVRNDRFVFPYNLGVWKNIKQVLFEPLSDGIEWPVIDGCHQYTFTYEQKLQKRDKMANAYLYRIVSPYNGRFFPLFSQGIRVCITFPINDDQRLVLVPGDEVLVTHCHKRWLYGQKLTKCDSDSIHRQKGWFPAQCAALLIKPKNITSNDHDNTCDIDEQSGDIKKNN